MNSVTPHEGLGSMETELFPFLIGHVLGPGMGTKLAGDFLCFASHFPCYSKIILLHLERAGRQESRNECQGSGHCLKASLDLIDLVPHHFGIQSSYLQNGDDTLVILFTPLVVIS